MAAGRVPGAAAARRGGTRRSGGRRPSCRRSRSTRRASPGRGRRRGDSSGSCTTRRSAASGRAAAPVEGWDRSLDIDRGRLDRGVRAEVGAEQPAVEGPVVLGVGGGVDPDPAAAAADVGAEGALLPRRRARPRWCSGRRRRRKRRRRFRVKALASSVARDREAVRPAELLIAAIPAGIESCRNPAVLEKTSTWARGLGLASGSLEQAIRPAAARPSRVATATAQAFALAEIRMARLWRAQTGAAGGRDRT